MNEDVINLIFSFIIPIGCCSKKLDIKFKIISKSINYYFQLENCEPFIKYNNKYWCKYHDYYEYKLTNLILKSKKNFNSIFTSYPRYRENITLHLKDEDYDKYDLINIYHNVTDNDDNCVFSHTCCSNHGIVFHLKN